MICKTCKIEKSESEFYKRHTECKICNVKRSRRWVANNSERNKENVRRYVSTHKKKHALEMRRFRAENPDKTHSANQRHYWLHRKERLANGKIDRTNNPQREYAHGIIKNLLKFGKIERPAECSKCGKVCHVDAHHPDYSKPREIVWLCKRCHVMLHRAKYITLREGEDE